MRAGKLAVLVVLALRTAAHALDIASCGIRVPPGETGVLSTDLVCPSSVDVGVQLDRNATLDLNGHSLVKEGLWAAVLCLDGRCTVLSSAPVRGVLEGNYDGVGIYANDLRRLAVTNVSIRDFSEGIYARTTGRVDLTDVDVSDCAYIAVYAKRVLATKGSSGNSSADS